MLQGRIAQKVELFAGRLVSVNPAFNPETCSFGPFPVTLLFFRITISVCIFNICSSLLLSCKLVFSKVKAKPCSQLKRDHFLQPILSLSCLNKQLSTHCSLENCDKVLAFLSNFLLMLSAKDNLILLIK